MKNNSTKLQVLLNIAKNQGDKVIETLNFGKIEVWNFIECGRQSAEQDGNDEVEAMECRLSDEYSEVGAFFRKHGFTF